MTGRYGRLGLVVVGVCLALGMVETAQVRLGDGEVVEGTWWIAFWRVVPSWLLLAALTPVAVWATERWPVRGEAWTRSLLRHMLFAVPFSMLHLLLTAVWASVRPGTLGLPVLEGLGWLTSRYLTYDIVAYGALVGVIHAFRYHGEMAERRRDADHLVAELEAMRQRAAGDKLHPHFVLNTLNAITGLAARGDQPAVVRTLDAFSELLQATLGDGETHAVPLREELELLARYVDIQKVRFGERLTVRWEVDDATLDLVVPEMLLQPLVENAIAHGIGRNRTGGTVTVRALALARGVRLEVEDTGPGPQTAGDSGAHRGHGIGLDATRSRLEAMWGRGATLALERREGGGAVASIDVATGVGHPATR